MLLFVINLAASFGEAKNDPSQPPGFPAKPPPRSSESSGRPAVPPPGSDRPFQITYSLAKGWNIISFPFSTVLETSGFSYKLLRYEAGAYYLVDPVKDCAQINTRWGYIAFSDRDTQARATGLPNKGEIQSASFNCGWNLVGTPSMNPPHWSRLVATIGSTTHRILDVTGPPGDNKNCWLSSRAFRFDRKLIPFDIPKESNVRVPGRGLWFYAWHPFTLTILQDEKSTIYPEIKTVKPSPASTGQTVTISGSGFGESPDTLCISGIPVTEKYLQSWSSERILFTVPSYAVAGELVAYNDGKPSNSARMDIIEQSPSSQGATLTGKVQDSSKNMVSGAFVALGNGLSAYTGEDGSFTIAHVPQGEQTIQVSRVGHTTSGGKVTMPESGSKTVLLTLPVETPVSAAPASYIPERADNRSKEKKKAEKGTLYAVASAGTVDNKRWSVYRIDVAEWGDPNYSWKNIWYNDYGDTYYELKCPGAHIGQTYNFKIEWRCKIDGKSYTNTWSRKMYKDGQRENFDRPW